MDTGIKISIIVPVYNSEKYLEETLTSLAEQTLKEIEIICVNDGSTDRSKEILEDFANRDRRIRIITQKNSGQSAARNTGIKAAHGEFIGFLDADDIADKSAFEFLYNKSDGCDIVIGNICTYNQSKHSYDYNDPYFSINLFPQELRNKTFSPAECYDFLFRISVTPWNKIYRRSFILENRFLFIENLNFEDNPFFLDVFLKSKTISLAPDAVIFYRIDSSTSYSHSNGKNDYKKLDFFKIMALEENILKKYGLNNLKDIFNLHKKQTLFYWYKKIKNPWIKLKYTVKLFKIYPWYKIAEKHIQRFKFNNTLANLLARSNVYIWAEERLADFLNYVIKKSKIKNPVFVTESGTLKNIGNYEVKNIKDVTPNLVITITSGIYNYDKIVKQKLEKYGYEEKVTGLIFPV